MSEEECIGQLNKIQRNAEATRELSRGFRKAYCILAAAVIKQQRMTEEKGKEVCRALFEQGRGAGMFLGGEILQEIKTKVLTKQGMMIDTEKECYKEVLGVEITKKRKEREIKKSRELEPRISRKFVREESNRGGRGEKKKIKKERRKGDQEGRRQMQRKKEEDREYAEKMRRIEREIKRQ